MSLDLAIMMAKLMPEELLIEQLENAINEKKSAITDEDHKEANRSLNMYCTLVTIRFSTESKDTVEVLKMKDEAQEGQDMFKNIMKNKS